MAPFPHNHGHGGLALFTAGFRPFFLAAALWAALAMPLWLTAYGMGLVLPSGLPPLVWHAHEMVFGYGLAALAGVLLLSLQGRPLVALVSLWLIGRIAILFSAQIGAALAAAVDISFPAILLAAVSADLVAGRNWQNLPILAALLSLLIGDLLVHLGALGIADTAELGNRVGTATLLFLIALVGGRIVPSFTRSWLAKNRPKITPPAPADRLDVVALAITGSGLAAWAFAPDAEIARWAELAAGAAVAWRLSRWRGARTLREPLVLILHAGYAWLAIGLVLLGVNGFYAVLPPTTALHALTVGAIGTMTLAVMTRGSLDHTGRPLTAGPGTKAIYLLVTLAALLRLLAPLAGSEILPILWLAGTAWCTTFILFAILYGGALTRPRTVHSTARPT